LFDHFASVKAFRTTLNNELADTVTNYSGEDYDQIGKLLTNHESRKRDTDGIAGDIQAGAIKTLIDLTDDNYSLAKKTTFNAVAELIKQMLADSKTVDGNTISIGATSAGGSNVGNGTFVFSEVAPLIDRMGHRPGNLHVQTIKTETITADCIQDSTSRLTPESQEMFRVYGQRAEHKFSENWPRGSGASIVVSATSPRLNGGRGPGKNVLHNSDFEEFTSNDPDHWTIATGTAGTHVFAAGSGATQSNALKLVGDGSTNPKLTQTLRTTAGSLGQLNTDKPYTISFLAKYATARPGQTLRVSVTSDGSTVYNSGTIGRVMQATVASATLTTSYALYSIRCFTPLSLGKNSVVTIDFAGNMDNTSEVFIDDLVIAQMHTMGAGCGHVQVIPGATSYRVGDSFTAAITNNNEGAMQNEFDRFFGMQSMDLALPADTGGSENIDDSLIS
jgi:hypothetical protein